MGKVVIVGLALAAVAGVLVFLSIDGGRGAGDAPAPAASVARDGARDRGLESPLDGANESASVVRERSVVDGVARDVAVSAEQGAALSPHAIRVHVAVTGVDGAAVEGAEVVCAKLAGDGTVLASVVTATDALGVAETDASLGDWRVSAVHDGVAGEASLAIEWPGVHAVAIALAPAARVVGTVVSREDGAPIAGAVVRARLGHARPDAPLVTSAIGEFELPAWRHGATSTIEARADGFGGAAVTLVVQADGTWAVPTSEAFATVRGTPRVRLELPAAKRVTGAVVDADGMPLEGARVGAVGHRRTGFVLGVTERAVGWTDASGAWVIDGLSADLEHGLCIEHEATGFAWVAVPSGATTVDVGVTVLPERCELAGALRSTAGSALGGIDVAVTWSGAAPIVGGRATSFAGFATTSADGRFTLGGLAAGRYELRASRGLEELVSRTVELAPGATDLGVLEVATDLRQLAGRAAWRDGTPCAGAIVRCLAPSGASEAVVAADGTVNLTVGGDEFARWLLLDDAGVVLAHEPHLPLVSGFRLEASAGGQPP